MRVEGLGVWSLRFRIWGLGFGIGGLWFGAELKSTRTICTFAVARGSVCVRECNRESAFLREREREGEREGDAPSVRPLLLRPGWPHLLPGFGFRTSVSRVQGFGFRVLGSSISGSGFQALGFRVRCCFTPVGHTCFRVSVLQSSP